MLASVSCLAHVGANTLAKGLNQHIDQGDLQVVLELYMHFSGKSSDVSIVSSPAILGLACRRGIEIVSPITWKLAYMILRK